MSHHLLHPILYAIFFSLGCFMLSAIAVYLVLSILKANWAKLEHTFRTDNSVEKYLHPPSEND